MTESSINSSQLDSLQEIAVVGGARAHELQKVGITDVRELSCADADELTEIYGIGSTLARTMIGQAQGLVRKFLSQFDDPEMPWADTEEEQPIVAPTHPDYEKPTDGVNVALVIGDDRMKSMTNAEKQDVIWEAVTSCDNFELNEVGTFGFMENSMGGPTLREWVTTVASRQLVGSWAASADWDAYEDDEDMWKAARDRNERVVGWADEIVVILDGNYVDNLLELTEPLRDVGVYHHEKRVFEGGVDESMIEHNGAPPSNVYGSWGSGDDTSSDDGPDRSVEVEGREEGLWHEGQMDVIEDREEVDTDGVSAGGGVGTSGPKEHM